MGNPLADWSAQLPLHLPLPARTATQWLPGLALLAAAAYPVLCAALRGRHLRRLRRAFPYGAHATKTTKPYSAMTDEDAYEIIRGLSEWDCPGVYEMGLQFALVRTYGIPSISHLLLRTRQLSAFENVGKRYADTVVLVAELYGNPPSSRRGHEAFARMNFLHNSYTKAGKISNDDMLYVLSLFMTQPLDYIDRLDWRKVTELERCALGVFHKSMGDAMDIDLSPLPSARTGWRDGLQFYDELARWAQDYEEKEMVPHPENRDTALPSLKLLTDAYPAFMQGFAQSMAVAAIDDRFRESIMASKPPPFHQSLFEAVFAAKRFVCRYLLLPRWTPYSYFAREFGEGEDLRADGVSRYLVKWDNFNPVYVRPTAWNRWLSPAAWAARAMGKPVPGDEGTFPEGYVLRDVGPANFVGKGHGEGEGTVEKLATTRKGGCPFG